ncbi:MAG: helix-turn-helix domain-containing protein, partial [Gammaproteobacteria bacterium]
VMEVLGIGSRNSLYALIHSGELRSYTIGRRRFASREAIIDFIKRREEKTSTQPILPRAKRRAELAAAGVQG